MSNVFLGIDIYILQKSMLKLMGIYFDVETLSEYWQDYSEKEWGSGWLPANLGLKSSEIQGFVKFLQKAIDNYEIEFIDGAGASNFSLMCYRDTDIDEIIFKKDIEKIINKGE